MYRYLAAIMMIIAAACTAHAWEPQGKIYGTNAVEYSELSVAKDGVGARITNGDDLPIKISLKLLFFDKDGNTLGYAIFGLREIPAGAYSDYSNIYLSGKWKECKRAFRVEWQPMTYELVY